MKGKRVMVTYKELWVEGRKKVLVRRSWTEEEKVTGTGGVRKKENMEEGKVQMRTRRRGTRGSEQGRCVEWGRDESVQGRK